MKQLNKTEFEEFCIEILSIYGRSESLYHVVKGLTFRVDNFTVSEKRMLVYSLYAPESPENNIKLTLYYMRQKEPYIDTEESLFSCYLQQPRLYRRAIGEESNCHEVLIKYFT